MAESRNGGGSRIVLAVVLGVMLAATNAAILVRVVTGDWSTIQDIAQQGSATAVLDVLRSQFELNRVSLVYLLVSPLLLGLVIALVGVAQRSAPQTDAAEAPEADAKKPGEEALRLLRILQEDARFIDFIQEDIDGYDDGQVGAAARSVHSGCRKALDGRVKLQRINETDEGEKVTIEVGFDPAQVRLTGNVGGGPPFSGTLQHGGWRAVEVTLPESPGGFDASVIAPAEVEIA
jgi:hypothetical protein